MVACKKTNEYCPDITKLTSKQIRDGIKVKDGRDKFSRMKKKHP